MNGIDWSEHDNRRHPGLDITRFFAGFDFVVVRLANENAGVDAYVASNIGAARACGKPYGFYAWPVAGWGFDQNRALARSLLNRWGVPPLGLWADAEHSPRGFASHDEVYGFVVGCLDANVLGGYYCGIYELYRSPVLDPVPWWVSDYGPYNDGNYYPPDYNPPVPPPDRPWHWHQFTSLGWPGGGSLDVNYAPTLTPSPSPPARRSQMYIVQNNENPAEITLHTAHGITDHIDAHYRDVLVFCGVPVYNLPAQQFADTELIHYAQRHQFIEDVAKAVNVQPAPGVDIPAIVDAVLDEESKRLQE